MRVDQKVFFVNYSLVRSGRRKDILYDDNVDYIFYQDSVYEADDFHMKRNSKDLT